MPRFNPDKKQMNLFLHNHIEELFKDEARKAGYGSRPSPFLTHLLKFQVGDIQAIYRRLQELQEHDPIRFDTDEQKFFAKKLSELLLEMAQ